MNLHYDKASDSLYIALSAKTGFDSEEAAGVVMDYDKDGHIVGIDIEDASRHFNLSTIHVEGFKPKVEGLL